MRRFGLATAIVVLIGLLLVPAAGASFHLMKVREVYLGSAAAPESKYVELQMYASGQQFVKGHSLRTYNTAGALIGTSAFAADVANGGNQSTILIATQQAAEQFGVVPDAELNEAGKLLAGGGAVCWEALDCVAWGGFKGSLPGPTGPAAAPGGVPEGSALQRTIARGCATALDQADDSDSGAADFALAAPAPRPNSVAPTEQGCGSGGAAGGGGDYGDSGHPGHGTPRTILRRKPPMRTADRTPSFRFGADETRARFQCKLDGAAYKACRSPFTTRRLAIGAHVFKVRAIDSEGRADPSPASYRFRVVPKRG